MPAGNSGKLALNERVYDFAKDSATLYLPALGVLYAALAGIWGLPNAVQVVGTLAALATFIGVVIKISSASYNANGGSADGTVAVDGGYPSKLSVDLTPEELSGKQTITLQVVQPDVPVETVGSPSTPGTVSQ